jgi:hypothetical protein
MEPDMSIRKLMCSETIGSPTSEAERGSVSPLSVGW